MIAAFFSAASFLKELLAPKWQKDVHSVTQRRFQLYRKRKGFLVQSLLHEKRKQHILLVLEMCREESKTSFHNYEICEVCDVKMQVFSSEVETFCPQCGFTTLHEKKIKETKHYFLLRRIKQFL